MYYTLDVIYSLENVRPGTDTFTRAHETLRRPVIDALEGTFAAAMGDRYLLVGIDPSELKEKLETAFQDSAVQIQVCVKDTENVNLVLVGDEPALKSFSL